MPSNAKTQRVNLRLSDAAAKDLKHLCARVKRNKADTTSLAYSIMKAVADAEEAGNLVTVVSPEGVQMRRIQIPRLEPVVVELEK